jgi:hypothetical protein
VRCVFDGDSSFTCATCNQRQTTSIMRAAHRSTNSVLHLKRSHPRVQARERVTHRWPISLASVCSGGIVYRKTSLKLKRVCRTTGSGVAMGNGQRNFTTIK